MEGANALQRGGLLRLGAVLTATSAPLRTSPVKRGDWVLRRIMGIAVPPPPADAGSIPADDKLFGGLSAQAETRVAQAQCHLRQLPCAHRSARLLAGALRFHRPLARKIRRRQAHRGFRRHHRQDRDRGRQRPARLPEVERRPGAAHAFPQADRLCARPHDPALRHAADRPHGGGRQRRHVLATGRRDCSQPPVPQSPRTRSRHRRSSSTHSQTR